jgi:hypothetical protein
MPQLHRSASIDRTIDAHLGPQPRPRPAGMGQAIRAGCLGWPGRRGTGLRSRWGGVSMYIGPPHIWDTQNGLFLKRKIDNTTTVAVNQLPIQGVRNAFNI